MRWGFLGAALMLAGSTLAACGEDGNGASGASTGGAGATGGGGGDGGGAGLAGQAGAGGGAGQTCGNAKVEGTEQCDDGNLVGGDGCENTCDPSCTSDGECDDGDPCTGVEKCGANHACAPGTPLADGADCGNGNVCVYGNCVAPQCGDGQKQSGEECDDGNATSGDGCDFCKLSCVSTDPTRDCSTTGDECDGSNVCDDAKHTCTAGVQLSEGASCLSAAGQCKSGICTLLTCGNSQLDAGEECDPPAAGTCSAQCEKIVTPVCGNGTIEAPEQCDDGNTANLDGCDSKCAYETVVRMVDIDIMGGAAPSFCSVTKNQLGNVALTSTARDSLNGDLQASVDKGSTNLLVDLLGLGELTGTSDPSVELGLISGAIDGAKGAWPADGSNPIDWWFKADPSTVDSVGLPTGKLGGGKIQAKLLTAGPGDIDLTLVLGGATAVLSMRDAKLRGVASGTPDVPAPPPASLASGLTVFKELVANQGNQGLCGSVTVESLAKIPIPEALTTGISACQDCPSSKQYTYCGKDQPVSDSCNSLLDALVGGCKAFLCAVTVVNPTQPDVAKPNGAQTPLATMGSLSKVPAADTNGNLDAYSSFLSFRARRAHLTGKL